MTEIKDLNVKIGEFVGPDPETLINMGKVHVEFKEDVADLLKKAFVHVKKMKVMKELVEYANASPPLLTIEMEDLLETEELLTLDEQKKCERYVHNYHLWLFVSDRFFE